MIKSGENVMPVAITAIYLSRILSKHGVSNIGYFRAQVSFLR